jgi:alpha-beta hydrolase superfamily lysophospholipase
LQLSSIVAVHGLGEDARQTWTNAKTRIFWLKDCLPHDLSDARIMTFGYNAAAALGRSMADVVDHARDLLSCLLDKRNREKVEDTSWLASHRAIADGISQEARRPIIFLAHSLGGIIVKQVH